MNNKLKQVINKIVREELTNEDNTAFITTAKGREAVSYKDTKELDAIKNNQDIRGVETAGGQKLKEMARKSEVLYKLKPDFKEDLVDVQSKLSKAEFKSLVDIVKVLKSADKPLTATDILRLHNENNPDRQYATQQSFIRPLVIGAIGKKRISYDDLPFSVSQKDISTPFEKAQAAQNPNIQTKQSRFGREMDVDNTPERPKVQSLPADKAELAEKTLEYKRARESYRKADTPEEKDKYIDKMQSIVDSNESVGQELAQQYSDGILVGSDPVLTQLLKKYNLKNKKRNLVPKISTQNTNFLDTGEDNLEIDEYEVN